MNTISNEEAVQQELAKRDWLNYSNLKSGFGCHIERSLAERVRQESGLGLWDCLAVMAQSLRQALPALSRIPGEYQQLECFWQKPTQATLHFFRDTDTGKLWITATPILPY